MLMAIEHMKQCYESEELNFKLHLNKINVNAFVNSHVNMRIFTPAASSVIVCVHYVCVISIPIHSHSQLPITLSRGPLKTTLLTMGSDQDDKEGEFGSGAPQESSLGLAGQPVALGAPSALRLPTPAQPPRASQVPA